jgi:hypothetical protein
MITVEDREAIWRAYYLEHSSSRTIVASPDFPTCKQAEI